MRRPRILVVGAGIGGLVCAVRLAVRDIEVTLLERAPRPGGKMREIHVDGTRIDSGPTVLTLPDVFDDVFAAAGACFADRVPLRPLDVLARHAWTGGARLDLFSDPHRTADAIGGLAGSREARGYLAFAERARQIYQTLERSFIRNARPGLPALIARVGPLNLRELLGISPFGTLAGALADHFADPRLRQLFGRYATYCGSSPLQAPATLMLIAHVERLGVWRIEGGMYRLVEALLDLARSCGAVLRCGAEVAEILVDRDGARGVALAGGEILEADGVVSAVDVGALAQGEFGRSAARAVPPVRAQDRSLSAMTLSLVGELADFPLAHHTVFFSDDYGSEFQAIAAGRLPRDPTVYVCAPDRDRDAGSLAAGAPERLFCIVNAPAESGRRTLSPEETSACVPRTLNRLSRCGARLAFRPGSCVATSPADFARLFPGTGGALYGRATHGWTASFQRPGSRSRIPRLYLAGGSTHPGAGVPMAAISGMLAASCAISDLTSTARWRRAATRGGTSTR